VESLEYHGQTIQMHAYVFRTIDARACLTPLLPQNTYIKEYVHRFPEFLDKIQECIRKPTIQHYTNGTAERFCGLRFLPYNIFAFVDCKIYRCCRPLVWSCWCDITLGHLERHDTWMHSDLSTLDTGSAVVLELRLSYYQMV
jgi:hypothetical protein